MRHLKCSKCDKKVSVGEEATATLCEKCTYKNYEQWIKKQIKKNEISNT